MSDEGFFFLKVAELSRRPVVTCGPDDDVLSVASLMRSKRISGVVVCVEGQPVGIITDRDLRNRLEEIARSSGKTAARAIMSAPVITIREDEHVLEAIYRMAQHRIHRLVVVDAAGALAGILTNTDLIRGQTTSPLYFSRDIEKAGSLQELTKINTRVVDVISYACRTGARTADVIRLIAHFHDAITQRVIRLLLEEMTPDLPDRFAFLALGSEGRREQTLKTDQDNAIAYADDLTPSELVALEAFSVRLIDSLIRIGVPPCPGGTMANNPLWRRSVSEWSRLVEGWIQIPDSERMVDFGMFCDLRTVYGRPEYERHLKEVILRSVTRNGLFLVYVARNILRFPPPLGLLGRFKGERSGPYKGRIDLKKAGIFAITEGVTLLALEAGVLDGGTRDKLQALSERGLLPLRDLERIGDAFHYLCHLRLKHQLEQIKGGEKPDNYLDPGELSDSEKARFREALESVQVFQYHIKNHFQVEDIPH